MSIHVLFPERMSQAGLRPRPLTFAERMSRDMDRLLALQDEADCLPPAELRLRAETAQNQALGVVWSLRGDHDAEDTMSLIGLAAMYYTQARYYEAAAEAKS